MPLQVLLKQYINEDDVAGIQKLIDWACTESEQQVVLGVADDIMLFIHPLNNYSLSGMKNDNVLCFVVNKADLIERIRKIVGNMEGELLLYYKNDCILGDDTLLSNQMQTYDSVLDITSQEGNFKGYLCLNSDHFFSWGRIFTRREMLIFLCCLGILLVLDVFIACKNFKPMWNLVEKYQKVADDVLIADWESLDAFINSLISGKERSREELEWQVQLFKENIIRLIAAGGYSEQIQEYMTLLNIKLETDVFGIIICLMQEPNLDYRTLVYESAEKLSDDKMFLYPYRCGEVNWGVLAAVEDEEQLAVTVEVLQDLFASEGIAADIQVIEVCHELKSFGSNMVVEDSECMPELKSNTVIQVLKYIKDNYTNCNLSLDLIAEEFQINAAYLSRVIKQETGMNYKDYVGKLRMEKAKQLLADKNITILDACKKSGYNNVSYFIKVFQKYTGETPGKYKDNISK